MKYIALSAAFILSIYTAHLLNERPCPSTIAPATAAILSTLSPDTIPNLRLAEYLSGDATDFAESDMAKASPVLAKAARLKANELK